MPHFRQRSHRAPFTGLALACYATLVLLLGAFGESAAAETRLGQVPVRSFGPTDYDAHPQCWAMVQDSRGLIHVGNTDGLLTFDGARWQKQELDHLGSASALCVGPDGSVYVGSTSSLGRLRADTHGELRYESLRGGLSEEDLPQGDVWYATATSRETFMASLTQIYRIRIDGAVDRIDTRPGLDLDGEYFALDVWRDELWVAISGRGLFRWTGDRFLNVFRPGPATQEEDSPTAFRGDRLSDLCSTDEHLYIVESDRLYRYDGEQLEAFATEVDSLLASSWAYVGRGLSGGRLAIGTVESGAVLLSGNGELLGHWDQSSGLLQNAVSNLGFDSEGGLWVCQEVGVVRIDIEAPIDVFPEVSGLVTGIAEVDGGTYLTTSHGFYRLASRRGSGTRFELLSGSNDFTGLAVTADGLFVADSGSVSRWKNGRWTEWAKLNYPSSLVASKHIEHRLLAVSRDGLVLISTENGKIRELSTTPLPAEGSTLVERRLGEVWIGSREGIVTAVRLDDQYTEVVEIERYGPTKGVPPTPTMMVQFEDEMVLGSSDGLRSLQDHRFSARPVNGLAVKNLALLQTHGGRLWALVDGSIGELRRTASGPPRWSWSQSFSRNQHSGRAYSFVVDDASIWASQANRLVRWDVDTGPMPLAEFSPILRRVVTASDSTVWTGASDSTAIDVRYRDNSLRFEFAATTQRGEGGAVYRSRLEGHDDRWSDWSIVPYREYTNLHEGEYALHLLAQDAYGALSRELVVPLRVSPPWTRSAAARLLLVLAMIGIVAASSLTVWHIRSQRLTSQNIALEYTVRRRTEELYSANTGLRESNHELMVLNGELQRVSEQRMELLGMAAHDLKNPICNIRSLTELLEEYILPSSEPGEYVTMIQTASDRMLENIQNILQSAAAEAGAMELDLAPCNAVTLAQQVLDSQRPIADAKGQTLDLQVVFPKTLDAQVIADAESLFEAFVNLVSNAIKYSPPESLILISVGELDDETLCLQVVDQGPGLSPEDAAKLFRPFQRLTPRPTADEDSCGLGLHIVKHIVELHGGRVRVDTALGQGSTFAIELPRPLAPDSSSRTRDAERARSSSEEIPV